MLLPLNSRKLFFFIPILILSAFAGQPVVARPLDHGRIISIQAPCKARHSFLSRLPRTNKARKYDTFFLNQLPRQTIAFNNTRTIQIAGTSAHDI